MANYASDSDLIDYQDKIFDYGIASFNTELTKATADVINLIKSDWWVNAARNFSGLRETVDYGPLFPTLDVTYLNTAELVSLTVYRAFSAYIFPRLSKFQDTDGDAFTRMAEFYAKQYDKEWKVVSQLPLYDFDKDSQFEDTERTGPLTRRLSRA